MAVPRAAQGPRCRSEFIQLTFYGSFVLFSIAMYDVVK